MAIGDMASSPSALHGELNLILTGYVEPNRPRIARQLARRLGLQLVDVERELEERQGDSLRNLRAAYGERHVRAIESELLAEAALHRRGLIRVSGHSLLRSGRLPDLQRSGVVICLVASLDSILRRMHLSLGARYHDPGERARALGELQREWQIRQAADVVEFDATAISDAILIERIIGYWSELALRRG